MTYKSTRIRRILVSLFGALAAVAATVAVGWWSMNSVTGTFHWVEHTHQVLYELEATLAHAVSIQSGVRGFGLTGEERYLGPFDAGILEVQHSIGRLGGLVADNPPQSRRLRRLASLVDEEVAVMQQRLAARRAGGLVAASVATADGRGKRVVDEIRDVVLKMQQEERGLLAMRSSAAVAVAWETLLLVGATAVAAGSLILWAIREVRVLPAMFSRAQTT